MKKLLLIALWACYAMTSDVKAQYYLDEDKAEWNNKEKDTIRINPSGEITIILIGKNKKGLHRYENADSLIQLFLADIDKAIKNSSYPTETRLTYYFVSANGKRRLKAENSDYGGQTIDVEKERWSLSNGIQPYEYIIYAFENNYEMYIYLKDPSLLTTLSQIRIKDALAAAIENKKVINQSTRIEIEKTNEHWMIKNHGRDKTDYLELSPSFGLTLVGNRWSPFASFNLNLIFDNKYSIPFLKTGVSYGISSFADWSTEKFTNLNMVASYDFKVMTNISGAEPKWVGLQAGFMKSYEKTGPLHNKFKTGFVVEGFGGFGFSLDVIYLKNQDSIYGLTVKMPF
ncbi:MAG: hypothetical protein ACO1G9_15095 [Bacteroidota bacterium]